MVAEVLDSFGVLKLTFVDIFKLVLGLAFPIVVLMPSQRFNLLLKFRSSAEEIERELLERTRKEKEGDVENKKDHSVMGLLSMFD